MNYIKIKLLFIMFVKFNHNIQFYMLEFRICFLMVIITSMIDCNKYTPFQSTILCVKQNNQKCLQWQTSLTFHDNSSACFPGHIAVVGRNGSILLSKLKIGDQILVYKQGYGPQFQPMTAWLHRDPKMFLKYEKIHTWSDSFILISAKHNIAISDQNENGFKYQFAQKVQQGQLLFSYSNKNEMLRVRYHERQIEELGVYAPYTDVGNFFISSVKEQSNGEMIDSQQYILVHCLAHVPAYYHKPFHYLMYASSWLPLQLRPTQQKYIHPVCHLLSTIFPWAVHQYDDYDFRYYSMHQHDPNAEKGTQLYVLINTMVSNVVKLTI